MRRVLLLLLAAAVALALAWFVAELPGTVSAHIGDLTFETSSPVAAVLAGIGFVVLYTLVVELAGALALAWLWRDRFDLPTSLWHGIFHSISGFCTAGFSTFTDNLMQFRDDTGTNLVINTVSLLGGIGVSGAPGGDRDEACAKASIAAIQDSVDF